MLFNDFGAAAAALALPAIRIAAKPSGQFAQKREKSHSLPMALIYLSFPRSNLIW
jgi:hypothetical protein